MVEDLPQGSSRVRSARRGKGPHVGAAAGVTVAGAGAGPLTTVSGTRSPGNCGTRSWRYGETPAHAPPGCTRSPSRFQELEPEWT